MALISQDEIARRRAGNADVVGTHAMEGLFPDEATTSILRQYEEGTLTLSEFSAAMDKHAQSLLAGQRKMAEVA